MPGTLDGGRLLGYLNAVCAFLVRHETWPTADIAHIYQGLASFLLATIHGVTRREITLALILRGVTGYTDRLATAFCNDMY